MSIVFSNIKWMLRRDGPGQRLGKGRSWIVLGSLAGLVLAACSRTPAPTSNGPSAGATSASPPAAVNPTAPAPPGLEGVVTVIGHVEPVHWVELSFQQSGPVAEVLVTEGQSVAAGQILARLETADWELAVQAAEAAVEAARASLAEASVGPRPEEIAASEGALAAAQAAITGTSAEYARLEALPSQGQVAAAQAAVAAAEAQVIASQIAYDELIFSGNLGGPEEKQRYQLIADQQALAAAQANLADVQAGPTQNELTAALSAVSQAVAQADSAQASLDLIKAGPRAETLAALQGEVAAAQIALSQARLSLEQAVLKAPFDGTIVSLDVRPFQQAAVGAPVIVLADLAQLQVVATDLDELNVTSVRAGQTAAITFDALPNRQVSGRVASVSLRALPPVTGEGGSSYSVIITLDEAASELLWGMTAVVRISLETSP